MTVVKLIVMGMGMRSGREGLKLTGSGNNKPEWWWGGEVKTMGNS